MHDRRLNGETLIFGNQGALVYNNMTWWDHQTESFWVQLTAEAISGPLEGTRLNLLPMNISPWSTWLAEHPDTLVLKDPDGFAFRGYGAVPRDGFVIGIELGNDSKAYPYEIASREQVINDQVGENPILVYVDPVTRSIQSYLRRVEDQTLTFQLKGSKLVDLETGSFWEPSRGLAIEGKLKGQGLLQVPYVTSFDWSWQYFHPNTQFYLGQ